MELSKEPIFSKVGKIWDLAESFKPGTEVYPSGYNVFDKAMDGGFRSGELITISASTGQGKTTFCQNLTQKFDKKGWASLWFSYEMNLWYLREKFQKLGCGEELKAFAAVEELKNTLSWIEDIIQEAIEDEDCRMVFIDHLHELIPLGSDMVNSLAIGGLVRELKRVAIRKNIIIFLIAHTKKIYQMEKIDLSSIRDSNLIAAYSDYVFLIERLKKDSGMKLETSDTEWTNQAKISIAKNRRTGDHRFITCNHFNGQFLEITDNYGEPPKDADNKFPY